MVFLVRTIILYLIIYIPLVYGNISLEISIYNNRGLDKGLVLRSELHEVKKFKPNKSYSMSMKNGISFDFRISLLHGFDKSKKGKNLSSVHVSGILSDKSNNKQRILKVLEMVAKVGKEVLAVYTSQSQEIKIKIKVIREKL